jgi:hypothetical protein
MDPAVQRKARDFYAIYCSSADGKNYQGLPCPAWDALTDAVRGHWCTVAQRAMELELTLHLVGDESKCVPDESLDHLTDPAHAREVWRRYSGTEGA